MPTGQDGVIKTVTPWNVVFPSFICDAKHKELLELDSGEFGILFHGQLVSVDVSLLYATSLDWHAKSDAAYCYLMHDFDTKSASNESWDWQ
jgi:hypothetical protein